MPPAARKYIPLTKYLRKKRAGYLTLTFAEIEEIIGEPLPRSAKVLGRRWWSNNTKGRAQGTGWINAGWRVVGLDGDKLYFKRVD